MGCEQSTSTTETQNPASKRTTADSTTGKATKLIAQSHGTSPQDKTAVALSPKAYRRFPIFNVTTISTDTKVYNFYFQYFNCEKLLNSKMSINILVVTYEICLYMFLNIFRKSQLLFPVQIT